MQTELAIIGAGPAGLAAAEIAVSHDISVQIIDEQSRCGGQIYRQPPNAFSVRNWLPGKQYRVIRSLVNRVQQREGIEWQLETTVLGVLPLREGNGYRYRLVLNRHGVTYQLDAKSVLIAAGCYDMPVLLPGWNLPGVMATGGIQAFVKSQQLVPGERFLFAGTHPLQLIVADQIQQAGGQVVGILFAQPLSAMLTVLRSPLLALRHADKLLYMLSVILHLRKKRIPIRFSRTAVQAEGDGRLQQVSIAPLDRAGNIDPRRRDTVACDRLGLCFSFLASSELARQAGAQSRWSAADGGWLITHDSWMTSSQPGLYVAGETTGVAGADAAMQEGRLAGLGVALALGRLTPEAAATAAAPVRRKLHSINRFAGLLKQLSCPDEKLLMNLLSEDTTLCKCEEVTLREFNACLEENPYYSSANAVKLNSRTGMGLCQGRYCNHYVSRLLAARRGVAVAEAGAFTPRFPAKPVRIGDFLEPDKES